MKRTGRILYILTGLVLVLGLLSACTQSAPTTPAPTTPAPTTPAPTTPAATTPAATTPAATTPAATPANVALGGKLYDNWIKTAQVETPQGNSPLWASQTTNNRTGTDTWRCKECHGWDYKGKDGAYGKGSHLTGFPGVYNAATTKNASELTAILKGSVNPNHNFSTYLKAEQISALVDFLKAGVIDEAQYIDYTTKKPKSADVAKGKQLYDSGCAACHGADGKTLNFGSEQKPEYVGTLGLDNPWEVLHKIRFGQPGAAMPSGVEQQWSIQNAIDVLFHTQTLPEK